MQNKYEPYNNFSEQGRVDPDKLDTELSSLAKAIGSSQGLIAGLLRDDGQIKDGLIRSFMLSPEVHKLFMSGLNPRGDWVGNGESYALGDLAEVDNDSYVCVIPHASAATFIEDREAKRWLVFSRSLQLAAGVVLGEAAFREVGTGPNDVPDIELADERYKQLNSISYRETDTFTNVRYPGGGAGSYSGEHVGPLMLAFPQGWLDGTYQIDMIIQQSTSEIDPPKVLRVSLTGDQAEANGGYWQDPMVRIVEGYDDADTANTDFRFGETVDGKVCLWIGETSSRWLSPSVIVGSATILGQNKDHENWVDGWSISFPNAFDVVRLKKQPTGVLMDAPPGAYHVRTKGGWYPLADATGVTMAVAEAMVPVNQQLTQLESAITPLSKISGDASISAIAGDDYSFSGASFDGSALPFAAVNSSGTAVGPSDVFYVLENQVPDLRLHSYTDSGSGYSHDGFTTFTDDISSRDIAFDSTGVMWVLGWSGGQPGVFKYTDGGSGYQYSNISFPINSETTLPVAIGVDSADRIFIVGSGANGLNVYIYADSGSGYQYTGASFSYAAESAETDAFDYSPYSYDGGVQSMSFDSSDNAWLLIPPRLYKFTDTGSGYAYGGKMIDLFSMMKGVDYISFDSSDDLIVGNFYTGTPADSTYYIYTPAGQSGSIITLDNVGVMLAVGDEMIMPATGSITCQAIICDSQISTSTVIAPGTESGDFSRVQAKGDRIEYFNEGHLVWRSP